MLPRRRIEAVGRERRSGAGGTGVDVAVGGADVCVEGGLVVARC